MTCFIFNYLEVCRFRTLRAATIPNAFGLTYCVKLSIKEIKQALVKADTLKYRAMTDTKSVRKNVSLPHWLLEFAEKHNINCSQVLQDALLAKV